MTDPVPPLRVGVLLPATDTAVELELPPRLTGVASLHVSRMLLDSVTVDGLRQMESDAQRQATVLARLQPDLLVFACTSGTFVFGAAHEEELVGRLEEVTGAPVITAARSVVAALTRRKAHRLCLGAPYLPDIVAAEIEYLSAQGFDVVTSKALSIVEDEQTARLSTEALIDMVSVRDDREDDIRADTALLSCTNLRTLEGLPRIQAAVGLPVVSSNSALLEEILVAAEDIRSGRRVQRGPGPDAAVAVPLP
jgi:maleate isomerase